MALSDQLNVTVDSRCSFARLVDRMDSDDRKAVVTFVAQILEAKRTGVNTQTYSAARLHRVLRDNGHTVALEILRNHVTSRCKCRKSS